ncbi:hypothetical protein BD560DRAFT_429402 [Blakeslea trispora]|nr:hypothetical protein BD560DRAFT_429402 [Blakeslea trispora]
MPLTNEIMFIYQACRQLTNNVIELRNDVNSMKEELAEVKDIVSRKDNVTQSSVVDAVIIKPDDRDTILETKTEVMASWKRTIFQTGSVAVDLMINDLELAKLDWTDISYRNLADEFKKSCRKYLTTYLTQKRIPLDRCVNFWLDDELMKHYYHSKRQTKKRKISKETAPSVASASNSLDAQSDFDINNCYEGSSAPQSPKRRPILVQIIYYLEAFFNMAYLLACSYLIKFSANAFVNEIYDSVSLLFQLQYVLNMPKQVKAYNINELSLFTINLGSSSLYHTVTHLAITKQTMQFLNTPSLNHLKRSNNYTNFQIISNGDDYTNMRILLIAFNIKQSLMDFYSRSKGDDIIVNIFAGERINSSYISKALWMIKGSSKAIMFFESLPSLKVDFQCSKLTVLKRDYKTFHPYLTLTATTSPSPCAHVASVMVMRDLKIDIQS